MKPEKIFFAVTLMGLSIACTMVFASIAQPDFYQWLVDLVFVNESHTLGQAGYFHAGMGGGIYAGWSFTLFLLARDEKLAKEYTLWTAILCGVVVWYLLDGLASVATGAAYNAVGNTLYLALLLWPIQKLRRQTKQASAAQSAT